MYGKLFASMYHGTLRADWEALVTFQQMIVLSDADGVVDMTPPAISAVTGIPQNIIEKGIEVLESPDPFSRTPDREGRRLERLDDHRPWGWSIVNHKKYKMLQDADHVREQNKERKRRQRANSKKSRTVTDGHGSSRYTDTDTDTDTKKEYTASAAPSAEHLQSVKAKGGKKITGVPAERFLRFWQAFGLKKGRAEAAAEWLKIKPDDEETKLIVVAAHREREIRPQLIEQGRTPKWAQGWLSGRRWEDGL